MKSDRASVSIKADKRLDDEHAKGAAMRTNFAVVLAAMVAVSPVLRGSTQESHQKPAGPVTLVAGDLRLRLQPTPNGIRLEGLVDAARNRDLLAGPSLPLFSISARLEGKADPVILTAEQGWSEVEIAGGGPVESATSTQQYQLRWLRPVDRRFGNLRVTARVDAEPPTSIFRWTLKIDQIPAACSLWRVTFPQVAIADLGPAGCVFVPKAAGEVERGVWQRPFRFSGTYPSGWCSMPIMAAYDENQRTGLSLAIHDPWGSTKDLLVESQTKEATLRMAVDHPVPDMGKPGNGFELSGKAEWRLLRGDWFDAAVAYRQWVRKEAKWYPKLTGEGRADTPTWMRELAVWALSGGPREQCVPEVLAFTRFLGPPAAVHWYNWHEIPFDNDYPHYFPTKPGFRDGVRQLQSSGTYVMPYINGRLWDTRDRGTEDYEFTRIAMAAVSKNEKGRPYIETYGSKERDGSPVRLGVMCPSTELWQSRVRQTVLRLMNECGVKGVYIDQIAAAAPTLCFDRSHGHPLGGGHWWTEGYWKLLGEIRRSMPQGCMLTTECNGEPYVHMLDGYLTWHWQYDGQVPAFPAVYGGAIQMFGRSYGGGDSRNLALRMRAGQQLVFGEQIGWINPSTVLDQANSAFFRDVVLLRRKLVKYFSAGEMARPPRLVGTIPTVRADWQWNGVDWVTTSAVLTGAWHQPESRRLVLVFVNVSDQPVTADIEFDARAYGFAGKPVAMKRIAPEGNQAVVTEGFQAFHEVRFPPRSTWAWELIGE